MFGCCNPVMRLHRCCCPSESLLVTIELVSLCYLSGVVGVSVILDAGTVEARQFSLRKGFQMFRVLVSSRSILKRAFCIAFSNAQSVCIPSLERVLCIMCNNAHLCVYLVVLTGWTQELDVCAPTMKNDIFMQVVHKRPS